MAGITDLPPELHLHILSYLPLSALIAARNTCRHWRHLTPLAPLPLIRRKLLSLYDTLCTIPAFQMSRRMAQASIRADFGDAERRSYLAALPRDTGDEFATWILEWPADAVVASLWPALDPAYNMGSAVFPHRRDIGNRMPTPGYAPATHTLELSLYAGHGAGPAHVVALPLLDEGNCWTHWVVLAGEQELSDVGGAKRRVDLRGTVFSKIRGADGDDGYAEFLESPSPLDCRSCVIACPSTHPAATAPCLAGPLLCPAGPDTWGPWLRYLEQETRKLQTSMEESGAWCGCVGCRSA
ncbi:F-box protein [Phanerochaete sordida]|uniref:F-box protein n=1 Tax=Phanerochaete sordida TaxID=48140 RepID=A0A9P3LBK8_9APHY|nr:F-box protein [Phanerochaete sordida]